MARLSGIEVLQRRTLLTTFDVTNLNDVGAGSLRQAILDSNTSDGADDIVFAAELSGSTILLTSGQLELTDDVTITGPGMAADLIIDAQQNSRVFRIDTGVTATLTSLTATNGDADNNVERDFGGSIGGGILNAAGTLTLDDVRIINNKARWGGGINNYGDGGTATINVIDSTIAQNEAIANAGGLYNWGNGGNAVANIVGSTFNGNVAGGNGGAIYNWQSTAQLSFVNSSIVANTANSSSGAMLNSSAQANFINSTVVGNSASNGVAGIQVNTGLVRLENSIVAGNMLTDETASEILGTLSGLSASNLIGDAATAGGLTDGTNNNIVGVDWTTVFENDGTAPTLADNGGQTQTVGLLPASSAIDAGDNVLALDADNNPLVTDQRGTGFARINDGDGNATAIVDIGAFEAPRIARIIVAESDDQTLVSENVGTDSFTIQLNFQPASDVVVRLTGSDYTEFVLDQETATFTPDNWNVPQTIGVMGIDDRDQDGDITTTLTVSVDGANSDPEFAAAPFREVAVLTTDNETTGVTGLGQSFDNYAPTQFVNYTIALTGTFPSQDGSLGDFDPILGQIGIVGFNFAPGGWAFADGQILQIRDNTALFSILGTTYGGDGETTFALPDLRGRVPIGADSTNGIALGDQIGSPDVVLTEANLPTHTHGVTGTSATLAAAGEGQPFDNQQPALALTPIVARQSVFEGLGEVVWFAGNFVPDQELPADGRLLPINTHTALFSQLGTTYGGDGETTFGLPDLRGRAAMGVGSGTGLTPRTQGQAPGESSTLITTENLPSHTHLLEGTTVEATGSATPVDNLHPATTMRYLVALTGIFPSRGGSGGSGRGFGGDPALGQIVLTSSVGNAAPTGFALANGQLLEIASNTALFSLYGTTYGGDGQTTFALPDLRGRLAAHEDASNRLGEQHGAETVTLTEATLPAHVHDVIPPEQYFVTTSVDEIDFTNTDVSLREAILSANYHPGLQGITFANELSGSTIALSAGQLELTDDVTITGPGMAADLVIDAQGNFRIFRIDTGVTATLTSLTAANGDADNNIERDFSGSIGGGILNAAGTLTLNDVQVINSTATWGGGINNYGVGGTATINVIDSTIANNQAISNAGGLYNWGNNGNAVANIVGSTFNGNVAGSRGGAIYNWQSTARINAANSSFVANTANSSAGGIVFDSGEANFVNSTIVGNLSSGTIGGIQIFNGTVRLDNTIVAGNMLTNGSESDISGIVDTSSASNLIGDAATAGGLADGANNNIVGIGWTTVVENNGTAPTLADNGGPTQTVALLTASPAIDAGNNDLALDIDNNPLATDQRGTGFDRINDGDRNATAIVDIGAFEFPPARLTVVITEDAISENADSSTATVTRTGDTASELTVTLISDDTSEATVPETVTIAAGQATSPAFDITAVDDTLVDGTQTVTITASATGTIAGTDNIDIIDDESAELTLSLVANSIGESDGDEATTATVTRNTPTTQELVVTLLSNDSSEVTLPATITIAAGETTSPVFQIAAVDDAVADGPQIVTLSAAATGFTDGVSTVEVTDDETATLTLSIASDTISENDGTEATTATVTRDGDTTSPLTVTLTSNDTTEATVPESITIAAGQTTSPAFNIAAIDDSEVDGTQTVTITASATGINNGTGTVDVIDEDTATGGQGNVDGDQDFDANDSFLIQLVQLAGTDAQIEQSKGSSQLTAAEIRTQINALDTAGDVDGDGDFDANDAFLAHLVKLSGEDAQIDQTKGGSPLSAAEIRTNVDALGSSGTESAASGDSRLTTVAWSGADALDEHDVYPTFDEERVIETPPDTPLETQTQTFWSDHRTWIDVL